MAISKEPIKRAVERALDELPAGKVAEVAVSEPTRLVLRTVPASHLDRLVGLVAWGGDAVADAERLYDDDPLNPFRDT